MKKNNLLKFDVIFSYEVANSMSLYCPLKWRLHLLSYILIYTLVMPLTLGLLYYHSVLLFFFRLDVPSFLQNDFQNNLPILTKRAVKGKKRKRRVIDISTQHPINIEDDKKLYRCKSARLDRINKSDLLHHSRTRIFNKPLYMLKDLKPRYFKDTPALMVGLQRAKRRKRQEQTDQTLLNDFLNAINDPPQEDDSISSTIAEQFQPYHEK